MKLKKKSGLIGAIVALSCASMISVGFASWVISQGDSTVADGTILVDNVENRIHTIDDANSGWLTALNGSIDNTKNKIVYGASDAALASTGWLKNDGQLGGSDTASSAMVLTVWYKLKVNNVSDTDKYSDIIDSVTFADSGDYSSASAYVGALPTPVPYINGSEANANTLVGEDGIIVFEIEFHWNATYDPDPYVYWTGDLVGEGKTYATEEARRQAAYDWFDGLEDALAGITYSLSIATK